MGSLLTDHHTFFLLFAVYSTPAFSQTCNPEENPTCTQDETDIGDAYNSGQGSTKAADAQSKDVIAGDEVKLPTKYALKGNYPNPFNPTTTISFDLLEASNVSLEVYDMMGRRVATLVNGELSAGSYEKVWNARNQAGAPVPSGVYIYRIRAGSFQAVKQMVLMK